MAKLWSHSFEPGRYWFRVFGWGLIIKDIELHGMVFSERNGYHSHLRCGKWLVRILPRHGF